MKPAAFAYHAPGSLEEAVRLRARLGPGAAVLAGGQSLVPMLNMRLARPEALIDLNHVPGLDGVQVRDGGVAVGAMTRQRALERSPEATAACPLLAEALAYVAHPAIRNRGTVGGSLAHADAAAELPAVLVALGGHVIAAGPRGTRTIAAGDLFRFHLTTSLEPDELLVEVFFPAIPAGTGWAFEELSRRHGDFGLAAVAALAGPGAGPTGVRLALAGVGPRPVLVEGDDPAAVAAACEPADDVHATAAYRRELVVTLAGRALARARARAREAPG